MLKRVNLLVKIVKCYFLMLVEYFLFVGFCERYIDYCLGLVYGVNFVIYDYGEYFLWSFAVFFYVIGFDFCIVCMGGLVMWMGGLLCWAVYLFCYLLLGFWLFVISRVSVDLG